MICIGHSNYGNLSIFWWNGNSYVRRQNKIRVRGGKENIQISQIKFNTFSDALVNQEPLSSGTWKREIYINYNHRSLDRMILQQANLPIKTLYENNADYDDARNEYQIDLKKIRENDKEKRTLIKGLIDFEFINAKKIMALGRESILIIDSIDMIVLRQLNLNIKE